MKRTISIILIIFFGAGFGYKYQSYYQNKTIQENINKIISNIRNEYKEINSDINLVIFEKSLAGLSTEGGEMVSYYDKNGNLKKAVITFYGEMGKKKMEFYFNNKNLIFLFQQQLFYNQPIYMEGFETEKIEEDRYYFYNQSLIKWIDNKKKERDVNTEEAQRISKELILKAMAILEVRNKLN